MRWLLLYIFFRGGSRERRSAGCDTSLAYGSQRYRLEEECGDESQSEDSESTPRSKRGGVDSVTELLRGRVAVREVLAVRVLVLVAVADLLREDVEEKLREAEGLAVLVPVDDDVRVSEAERVLVSDAVMVGDEPRVRNGLPDALPAVDELEVAAADELLVDVMKD